MTAASGERTPETPVASSYAAMHDAVMDRRAASLCGLLLAANLTAWASALAVFHGRSALLATAVLAYSFGLRHAFDADHIAAIDNVTRKLMQQGRRPIAAGLFFSLGHSSVVIALSAAVALTATLAERHFNALRMIGAVAGTIVSALFLLIIAGANIVVLVEVYRALHRAAAGMRIEDCQIDDLLDRRGVLGRLLLPAFALVSRSWQMYPLGLLFGLGFDTATEIGLLGISASQGAQGLALWSILVFPALFTAGMTLVDTADSLLMVAAYGWAFLRPRRKLYYNFAVTLASVVAALAVGGVEALGLVADKLRLEGAFWSAIGWLNDNFGLLGYAIAGFFVLSWVVSIVIAKMRGLDPAA